MEQTGSERKCSEAWLLEIALPRNHCETLSIGSCLVPASVVTRPFAEVTRMQLLPESLTYALPLWSAPTPRG